MQHVIITGASKGLGAALTEHFLTNDAIVHALARTKTDVAHTNGTLYSYQTDVSQVDKITETFEKIFSKVNDTAQESVVLINNAGIVTPVGPAADNEPHEIAKNIAVNLTAPMITTREFLRFSDQLDIKRVVLNISSGAGRRPMEGWSAYCSGKAGLDMFTKTVALEQQDKQNPALILSLAPGIVDTGMQTTIRSSSKTQFKQVEKFRAYKENGDLLAPEVTAKAIGRLLEQGQPENGTLLDVRDYL